MLGLEGAAGLLRMQPGAMLIREYTLTILPCPMRNR